MEASPTLCKALEKQKALGAMALPGEARPEHSSQLHYLGSYISQLAGSGHREQDKGHQRDGDGIVLSFYFLLNFYLCLIFLPFSLASFITKIQS